MARCLIIACGCRGRSLARELRARGHAVRGTTRDQGRVPLLEADGIEAIVADPDRVATLAPALEHVVVVCVLLGSADGSREQLEALHGPRLEMLMQRLLDSTVHGVVYESRGSVDHDLLEHGVRVVRATCEDSRIPCALLAAEPGRPDVWLRDALAAVEHALGGS